MAYIHSIHISILGTKRNRTNKYRIRLSSGGNIYIAETKQPQILNLWTDTLIMKNAIDFLHLEAILRQVAY